VLISLTLDEIRQQLPQRLPNWFESEGQTVAVKGDRVGFRETFVWNSDDQVVVATALEELLPAIGTKPNGPAMSPFGISQLLNHGFPPLPHTVYEGVCRLGPGDSLRLVSEHDRLGRSITSDYPWMSDLSRQDQLPSTTKLRELIDSALDDQLTSVGGAGILLLSSGKDSVALALALADGGHTDVQCVTFKSGPDDTEHVYAAGLCRRLGLEHHTVQMPHDAATTKVALLHFFAHSPLPSADQGTIPSVIVAHTAGLDHGGFIDGAGNDPYMGYLISNRGRIKRSFRVRNRHAARVMTNLIRHDSPINYFARSKAATLLPGRMFRDRETRSFYSDALDTEDFWYELTRDTSGLGTIDFSAMTIIRHTEAARSNPRTFLVARANGLEPLFPFCDEGIADYYFNLPETSRFNQSTRTNKVLLRRLLAEALDYDPKIVGSNYFGFDGASFLIENVDFVREEVLSCDLWLPEVESMLNRWLAALPKRPFLFHSLLALFMVSGWHNHSIFLKYNASAQ